jgi:hypothetical protein
MSKLPSAVSLPTYAIDADSIQPNERIHMGEGSKLRCCGINPSRATLRNWIRKGVMIRGRRFLLPSTRNPKRFTTVSAYRWWRDQINLLDCLERE